MSELSDRWHKLKSDIGSFTGELNSLAIRYEPLADVEEKAYKRGYEKGYKEAIAKTKADICNGCTYQKDYQRGFKYREILTLLDEISEEKKNFIMKLLGYMKKGSR